MHSKIKPTKLNTMFTTYLPRWSATHFIAVNALILFITACSGQSDKSNANTVGSAPTAGSSRGSSGGSTAGGSSVATNPSPTPTSVAPNQPSTPTPITPNPNEPTLSEKIKALEDSGALPKLDRSANIKGPDSNNNGVRDDIDAWIAALPITDKQIWAAIQKAQALQKTLLVDYKNKVSMDASGDELAASTKCLSDVFMPNYQESYKLSAKIEAMTANTKARAERYIQYNRAASGSSTSGPSGDTCK
jgi:hypothetical protein